MASSAESSSSSTARRWKYDVFVNFFGEDTRRGFTSLLYDRLKERGIKAFMDEDLAAGDSFSSAILMAIEESKFAITVLSPSYASSAWCLEELAEICRRMVDEGLRILPVFYDVDPADVRYQRSSFGEAFEKHESSGRYGSEKLMLWRAALIKVSTLAGWWSGDYRTDVQLVEAIVKSVCSKVEPIELNKALFGSRNHSIGKGKAFLSSVWKPKENRRNGK